MNPRTGALQAVAGIAWSPVQPPGLDDEDHHRQRGAERRHRRPVDDVPNPDVGDDRRLHAAERGRRGVRRHVPERVRGLLQLGVRPPRRQARGRPGWSPWPRSSASTRCRASPARWRARSRRPSTSATRWRWAPRPSARASCRPPRWRWPTSAATIAMGGRRPIPTLQAHQKPQFVRVISPTVAHEVEKMMVAVVEFGTGTSAEIPGVDGGRQDRHRRADRHTPRPGQSRRRTPTPGSSATPPSVIPRSWPGRYSPTRAPAGRRPRPRCAT